MASSLGYPLGLQLRVVVEAQRVLARIGVLRRKGAHVVSSEMVDVSL